MKKFVVLFAAALISVSLVSCMKVELNAEGVSKNVSMTGTSRKYTVLHHFRTDLTGFFVVFNLVTISNPDIAKEVNNQITTAQGDAVINLTIHGETNIVDGLVSYVTYTLLGLRTYTVEGDVIKYIE